MQLLKANIRIEDKYAGVTLGAINLPKGMIYIDAPLTPEDARAWRTDLLGLESGTKHLLVHLDTNIDRIAGARAMDTKIFAHESLSKFFTNRTGTFKIQGNHTGAEWESIPSLGNIRWTPPEITFTKKTTLYWGESPLIFEHHPGADIGAIWVVLPEEKIVFIGDTITKNQPPFFANANLSHWLEDLNLLASEKYQGYTIVSGRGGVCATSTLEKQQEFIEDVHKKLTALSSKNAEAEATENLIPSLLSSLRFLVSEKETFTQRLRYGLKEYYLRNLTPKEGEKK